jgi:chloride channel 3/4/5
MDVIRLDQTNTVKSLRDKLLNCVASGYIDSGFPILRTDTGGLKMVGYIGVNELEHALGRYCNAFD